MRLEIGPQEEDQEIRSGELLFLVRAFRALTSFLLTKSIGKAFQRGL